MRKLNFIWSSVQGKIASEPSPFIDDTHFRPSNKQVSPSRETLIICRTVRGNHEPSIAVIRPSDLLSAKTNYLYVSLRTSSLVQPTQEQLPVWFEAQNVLKLPCLQFVKFRIKEISRPFQREITLQIEI